MTPEQQRAQRLHEAEELASRLSDPPENIEDFISKHEAGAALESIKRKMAWQQQSPTDTHPIISFLNGSILSLGLYDHEALSNSRIPEIDAITTKLEATFKTKVDFVLCLMFVGGKQQAVYHSDLFGQHTFVVALGVPRPIDVRCNHTNRKTSLFPQAGDLVQWAREHDANHTRCVPTSKFLLTGEVTIFLFFYTRPLPGVAPKSKVSYSPLSPVVSSRCSAGNCGGFLREAKITVQRRLFSCRGGGGREQLVRNCAKCGNRYVYLRPACLESNRSSSYSVEIKR